MTNRFLLIASLFALVCTPAIAQDDPLVGLWQTQDKDAVIEFYACGDETFCGRFYWLQDEDPNAPSLDEKNKDPALRQRPLCRLTFLGGFQDKGEGLYDNGWLYSPRHGSDFSARLRLLTQDTLELRGYVLTPMLGGSQTWTRIHESATCHTLSQTP